MCLLHFASGPLPEPPSRSSLPCPCTSLFPIPPLGLFVPVFSIGLSMAEVGLAVLPQMLGIAALPHPWSLELCDQKWIWGEDCRGK